MNKFSKKLKHGWTSVGLFALLNVTLVTGNAQNVASLQAGSYSTAADGIKIRPSKTTAPATGYLSTDGFQMFMRAVNNPIVGKDSTLAIENLAGNIELILPRRATGFSTTSAKIFPTPSNAGKFVISKRLDGSPNSLLGVTQNMLELQPGTITNQLDIYANTLMSGDLQVTGSITGNISNAFITGANISTAVISNASLVGPLVSSGMTISNGNLSLSSGQINLIGSVSLRSNNAAAIALGDNNDIIATGFRSFAAGGSTGTATGAYSTVLGGRQYTGGQSNIAGGDAATVVGCINSKSMSDVGGIYSSVGSQILASESGVNRYTAILGGSGHMVQQNNGQGSYLNVIVGGSGHEIKNGGSSNGILAGGVNNALEGTTWEDNGQQYTGGSWASGIFSGQINTIRRTWNSVILGGQQNFIDNTTASFGMGAQSIIGGTYNTMQSNSYNCSIVGGTSNIIETDSGYSAIVAGVGSTVWGNGCFASGWGTKAKGTSQFVVGQYNIENMNWAPTGKLFIVGNGSSDSARSNAASIDRQGNLEVSGTVTTTGINITTTETSDISMGPFSP